MAYLLESHHPEFAGHFGIDHWMPLVIPERLLSTCHKYTTGARNLFREIPT
jgi:hypothetical protein